MKKILIAVLAALMVFSLAACAGEPQQSSAKPSEGASQGAPEGDAVKAAAAAYFAEFPGNRIVEWADVFAMIDAGDEPFILSIRQKDVYDQGHIKGAYLAAWGADLAEKVSMLPKDKPVYVYCYSGQTAGQAIALMNMLGIEAYSIKSGYNYGAVKVEGYEAYVETAANELPDAGAGFDADVLAFVKEYFNSVTDNGSYQITSADAMPLIEAGDVAVLDIRSAEDFEKGSIEGSQNIPFGKGMDFSGLPTDQKIVVTCYSGQTAGQAVAIMRALGYDAVSLAFGMKGAKGWAYTVASKAAADYFANFDANPVIKSEDLFAKADTDEELFIVDIRQQDVYNQGHLKGAYLAAWGEDLASKVAMLPKDKPVYIYCYTGQTAGQAVALMRMLGIDAYSVQSGYNNGISLVEGFEKYIDTTPNELASAGAEFDPFLLAKVEEYFNAVADNASFIIASADAKPLIDAGGVTVLDIRQADAFAEGHIAGALNIPFGKGMDFSGVPADKQVIVACYTGQTAGQTVAVLRLMGLNAVSLKGGMVNGWTAENLPVVTE